MLPTSWMTRRPTTLNRENKVTSSLEARFPFTIEFFGRMLCTEIHKDFTSSGPVVGVYSIDEQSVEMRGKKLGQDNAKSPNQSMPFLWSKAPNMQTKIVFRFLDQLELFRGGLQRHNMTFFIPGVFLPSLLLLCQQRKIPL